MLFVALAVIPMALACGAGIGNRAFFVCRKIYFFSGPITDKPTMKFSYNAPVSWTYNTAAAYVLLSVNSIQKNCNTDATEWLNFSGPGQALSQAAALNRINSDIEYAVRGSWKISIRSTFKCSLSLVYR